MYETEKLCPDCLCNCEKIWFKDVDPMAGTWMRVDCLVCPECGKEYTLDDSFDYKIR